MSPKERQASNKLTRTVMAPRLSFFTQIFSVGGLSLVTLPPPPAQCSQTFLCLFKIMESEIIEYLVNACRCCYFCHPFTKRPFPFGSPLHVKVGIKQDKIEVPLQVKQTFLSMLQTFFVAYASITSILYEKMEIIGSIVKVRLTGRSICERQLIWSLT